MSGWWWVAWAVAGATLEGIALFNSTRWDTLSEHLWVWLGVRTKGQVPIVAVHPDGTIVPVRRVMPKWTVRVARTVFVSALVWFGLHIATGWV